MQDTLRANSRNDCANTLGSFNHIDNNQFLKANNFAMLHADNPQNENLTTTTMQNVDYITLGDTDYHKTFTQQDTVELRSPVVAKESPNRRKKSKPNRIHHTPPKTYPCDLCDSVFDQPVELKYHKNAEHVLSKPYQCQQCAKQFNFEKNFTLHFASHTSAPATCPECGTVFQRISSFIGHLNTHQANDSFQCLQCNEEFEFEEYYERHLQQSHTDLTTASLVLGSKRTVKTRKTTGKYSCKSCPKSFPKPSLLYRHEITHTKLKIFECLECRQKFSQKASLDRHSMLHNGMKRFDCPQCTSSFSQRTNLITHINRVHPAAKNLEGKYPCSRCSCVFSKLNSLSRHISATHSREVIKSPQENDINGLLEQLKCLQDVCSPEPASPWPSTYEKETQDPIVDITPNYPALHIEEYKSEEIKSTPKESIINLVDYNYPNKEHSNRLVKEVVIDSIKWLECLNCSKRFQKPLDILRHIRVHTKEKPYECEMCGRMFALKYTLQMHMRIHKKQPSGVCKIFKCSMCEKRFDSRRSLDVHHKNHNNYKPYICPICFKTFGTSNNLRVHKKIHNPKDPVEEELKRQLLPPINENNTEPRIEDQDIRIHQCSKCGLKFKKLSHLKQHEDSHQGLKPYKCTTCQRHFTTISSLGLHQKIHLGHKTKQCDKCPAKFSTNGCLRRHQLKHSSVRNFLCPYCLKSFKIKSACKRHIGTHVKDIIKTVEVEQITTNENVESRPDLTNVDELLPEYILNAPNTSVDYVGSNDLIYVDLTKLLPESVENQNLPSLPNTEFAKEHGQQLRFINIKDLSNYKSDITKNIVVVPHESSLDIIDETPRTFHLDDCFNGAEFLIRDAGLKLAEKEKEENIQKKLTHVCETCGKGFKKPIDLRRHLRTHTKEKPFRCDICSRTFSLKSTLDSHKLTHLKDRPSFDCHVCGRSYATKAVLNVHLRLHTGDKPYKCDLCSKSFRTYGHRKSHSKFHLTNKLMNKKKK